MEFISLLVCCFETRKMRTMICGSTTLAVGCGIGWMGQVIIFVLVLYFNIVISTDIPNSSPNGTYPGAYMWSAHAVIGTSLWLYGGILSNSTFSVFLPRSPSPSLPLSFYQNLTIPINFDLAVYCDLWEFSATNVTWTKHYTTLPDTPVSRPPNQPVYPGARINASMWVNELGQVWLFSGASDQNLSVAYCDMWTLDTRDIHTGWVFLGNCGPTEQCKLFVCLKVCC